MIVELGATIMPVLQIQLLGDFRMTYNDTTSLTSKIHARQQTLLAYLLLHREAPQSRHHLAFLLWPDTGEAQALTNLRNLLHKLREALPESERFLNIDTRTVQWRLEAPYSLDVADFVSLTQSGIQQDLEKAVNLYRGELLPSCYDEWIMEERERLQQILYKTLERLVSHLEAARNYSLAIGYAQQLLRHDPLREETYRYLMRLHALNKDRAAIMHVYHTCTTTLQHELGVEPSLTTRQLYEQLSNFEPQPVSEYLSPALIPFIGRKQEWAQLQSLWFESTSKRPLLVLIKGEAGIGKTRLAEELSEWVRRQGYPVLTAHCYAAQGQLAYAPLVECLQPQLPQTLDDIWLTELTRLIPEILVEHPQLPRPTPITQGWQRLRFFKALAHALPKNQRALLLQFEDIQWCDRDTLDWLHYFLQMQMEIGLPAHTLIIATLRIEETFPEHPLQSILEDLRRSDQLTEIELGLLDESDTFLLASQVAGRPLDSLLKPILFKGSEGHPLFVVEMIRSGLSQLESQGEDHERVWLETIQRLPNKVRQVIQDRLAQLSPPTQELLSLASAIGRSFKFHVLKQASQVNEELLVQGLDELWRRRLIREQGTDTYDFAHEKIREVAYTSMSLARRRFSHRRIAQALENIYGPDPSQVSGQIAAHFELAGNFEHAIPFYERAAEEARRIYANTDAIRDYRRAIALLEGPATYSPSIASRLYEQLADVLHWMANYEEAKAVFQQAAQAVPATDAIPLARLYRKIGNSWREERCYAEALQAYQEAARILDQLPTGESKEWWQEWIQSALETMLVYYWLGDLTALEQKRVSLKPVLGQHGTPSQRVTYREHTFRTEFRRNRSVMTAELVSLAEEIFIIQQEIGNQVAIPSAQFQIGFAHLWHGKPRDAIKPILAALQLAEETDDISLQARCVSYLTVAFRQCDQVEETRRYAEQSLDVTTRAQMPEYIAMARANQAWLAWRADNLGLCQEFCRLAVENWHQLPPNHASAPFQWLARFLLIGVALYQEKYSWAIDEARLILDPSQQRLPQELESPLTQAAQCWEAGKHHTAQTLLHESIVLARQLHYL
jgi:DNA-binding SARP family transcriptional activator/tetratricopeptide (TPR) repeat protein